MIELERIVCIVLAVIGFVFSSAALAHSPYLDGFKSWTDSHGTAWRLAVLNGDSILLGDDPNRPVVLNSDGKIVAIGPIGKNPVPVCFTPHDCRILIDDGVLLPDPKTFGTPRDPDFYPEHLDAREGANGKFEPYGFKAGLLSLSDWPYAATNVLRARMISTLLILVPLLLLLFLLSRMLVTMRQATVPNWKLVLIPGLVFLFGLMIFDDASPYFRIAALALGLLAISAGVASTFIRFGKQA